MAFEPVRIGRRRRVDPVLIGVIAVVAGLLAAVAKPWEDRSATAGAASGSPVPSGVADPSATVPPSSFPSLAPMLLDDPQAAVTVLDALESHDTWGVRVVETAPDWRTGYIERWVPAEGTTSGIREARLPGSETAVVLGVTTPSAETPLDIRVWRPNVDGGWTWLDVHRIGSDRPAGALLLRPPRIGEDDQATWPPGAYRVELLMGTRLERIDIRIPDHTGAIPEAPPEPSLSGDVFALGTPLGEYETPGPFLIVGQNAVPLVADVGGQREVADVWLDPGAAASTGAPRVATVFQPGVAGMAVLLPNVSSTITGSLVRLAPDAPFDGPAPLVVQGDWTTRPPYIVFEAPNDRPWPAGVYAMQVSWQDPTGTHFDTWHIQLLPGEPDAPPAMLVAARTFGPFAGADGIVTGPTIVAADGSAVSPVRLLPFERSADDPAVIAPVACDETFIGGKPEVIGISRPVDALPPVITADVLFPDGRSQAQPLRSTSLTGITLVEPARGVSFAQGVYRLRMESIDGTASEAIVCLGTSPFEG